MKNRVTEQSQIIAYLQSTLDQNEAKVSDACHLVASARRKCDATALEQKQLEKVWKRRLLASNTLRSGDEIGAWDQASYFVAQQAGDGRALQLADIMAINRILTGGSGALRSIPIYTGDEEYLAPGLVGALWEQLPSKIAAWDGQGLVAAFIAYLWVITIHPFEGGNGRTARLCADWILLQAGYLPVVFPSPVATHVAMTINGPSRQISDSFVKFCQGVFYSYELANPGGATDEV